MKQIYTIQGMLIDEQIAYVEIRKLNKEKRNFWDFDEFEFNLRISEKLKDVIFFNRNIPLLAIE